MRQTQQRTAALSGTALKRLACVSMFADHVGASCLEAGGLAAGGGPQWAPALDLALRCFGRIAFPIYCFLLVEGFLHTHSVRRYAARLLAFAFISEVPFDWAFYTEPFYWQHQNVYWTLFLGLAAMALLRRFDGGGARTLAGTLCALGCAALAEALRTDYGAIGVLLIAALYIARGERQKQCLLGAAITLYEIPAPLAFVPVWFYGGQRGKCGRAEKWAYYLFYPAHLALLACVTNLVLLR